MFILINIINFTFILKKKLNSLMEYFQRQKPEIEEGEKAWKLRNNSL